jgi:hypothetical protein
MGMNIPEIESVMATKTKVSDISSLAINDVSQILGIVDRLMTKEVKFK